MSQKGQQHQFAEATAAREFEPARDARRKGGDAPKAAKRPPDAAAVAFLFSTAVI